MLKKKKFTIEERIMVYERVIEMYQQHWYKDFGACLVIHDAVRKLFNKLVPISRVSESFPEFDLFKPEDVMYDDLWFENDHERLIVLEFCILMLKK